MHEAAGYVVLEDDGGHGVEPAADAAEGAAEHAGHEDAGHPGVLAESLHDHQGQHLVHLGHLCRFYPSANFGPLMPKRYFVPLFIVIFYL